MDMDIFYTFIIHIRPIKMQLKKVIPSKCAPPNIHRKTDLIPGTD